MTHLPMKYDEVITMSVTHEAFPKNAILFLESLLCIYIEQF